ncbi:hypothetical protein FRB99_008126 [Tulasnella sp. 403]|nr:hypothetical protein FRB99_008126 [Tulasnella sp. 403]
MSSSVYYKFKSQRDESRITFDGTGISVFDLKKEIILRNNLKPTDIDLLLFDSADQEYKDDSFIIPRSTSVIAKRMPAPRGKGKAAMYVSGALPHRGPKDASTAHSRNGSAGASGPPSGGPPTRGTGFGAGRFGGMSRRFDGKDSTSQSTSQLTEPPVSRTPPPMVARPSGGDDEAASIAAMFAETSDHWEQTQEKMAHRSEEAILAKVNHITNKSHDPSHLDTFAIVATRRVIGYKIVPPMMIAKGPPSKGVMVTPEGGFVVAEPDSAAWERQKTKSRGLTEAEVKEKPPKDPALACPYPSCGRLIRDAVKTPCCQTLYCEECIHTHLLDGNFECPKCKTKIPSLDKLRIDSDMRAKVREYVRNAVEESRKESEESCAIVTQPTQVRATPDDTKEDEIVYQQPGNEETGSDNQGFIDPQVLVTQLQAQLAQLMMMQSNPTLPPTARMSVNSQIQTLTFQLKQAESMRDMLNMTMGMPQMSSMGMMNGGMNGMGMGMNSMGVPNAMMGGGMGMGMQPGMGGMNVGMPLGGNFGAQQQPGWKKGDYQPGWTNPFPMQQPAGDQSAYDRLPVNNRRPKRDRPDEFGEGGSDSKRQYWE